MEEPCLKACVTSKAFDAPENTEKRLLGEIMALFAWEATMEEKKEDGLKVVLEKALELMVEIGHERSS